MSAPTLSAPTIPGLPLPTCAEVARSGLRGAALADTFDARYPSALNDADGIETLALDEGQVANIVGYLACVAGRTNGDVGVAETGYTLFGSKRHGAAAFAALDRLEKGGEQADAAKAYAVQMRGYLDR
jgi:hypothetical protein